MSAHQRPYKSFADIEGKNRQTANNLVTVGLYRQAKKRLTAVQSRNSSKRNKRSYLMCYPDQALTDLWPFGRVLGRLFLHFSVEDQSRLCTHGVTAAAVNLSSSFRTPSISLSSWLVEGRRDHRDREYESFVRQLNRWMNDWLPLTCVSWTLLSLQSFSWKQRQLSVTAFYSWDCTARQRKD